MFYDDVPVFVLSLLQRVGIEMTRRDSFDLRRYSLVVAVCLGVLVTAGCGGSEAGPTGPVGSIHGKITYNGKPAAKGTRIGFVSDTSNYPGIGIVGNGGVYKTEADIPVATYDVFISPPEEETDPDEEIPAEEGDVPAPEVKLNFPKKYNTLETSGESVDVKVGDNEYNLDMKGS